MPKKELEYDIVSGVSIGAINASSFALFEKGKEREAAEFIKNEWLATTAHTAFEIPKHVIWRLLVKGEDAVADNTMLLNL